MMRSDSPWARTRGGKAVGRLGGWSSSKPGPVLTATTRSHAMRCAGSSGSTARSPPSPKRPPSITPGGKYTGSAQLAYNASPRAASPRPPLPNSVSSPVSRFVAVTVSGTRSSAKRVAGTRRAMTRCSPSGFRTWVAKMPLMTDQGSIAATSLRERPPSPAARSSGVRPAASAAPTTAPKDVPTIATTSWPASTIARQAPTQAKALAPPPLNTATTLLTAALVVSPIHHSAGSSLRRAVIAPLLVGRLGDDRRHLGGHAVVVERDVGEIAGVGVAFLAGERILGDHFDSHFHRCLAGEVDPGVGREQLAHVDRLAEVDFVDGDGDAP